MNRGYVMTMIQCYICKDQSRGKHIANSKSVEAITLTVMLDLNNKDLTIKNAEVLFLYVCLSVHTFVVTR